MTLTAPPATRPDVAVVRRPAGSRLLWLLAAVVVLALLVLGSFAFGARPVSVGEVISGLGADVDSIASAAVSSPATIGLLPPWSRMNSARGRPGRAPTSRCAIFQS